MRFAPHQKAFVAALLATLGCGRDLTGLGKGPTGPQLRVAAGATTLYKGQAFSFDVIYETPEQTRSVLRDADLKVVAEPGTVLSVDATGAGKALAPGAGTIRATFQDLTGEAVVQVLSATLVSLAVTPSPVALAAGGSAQVTVTGTLDNGDTLDLSRGSAGTTYQLSDVGIAEVSANGLVKGLREGKAQLTVSNGGRTSDVDVVVTGTTNDLVSIQLIPGRLDLESGQQATVRVEGKRADGSVQAIAPSAELVFQSNATRIATINNVGLITAGRAAGEATISANFRGLTATMQVGVRPPSVELIAIQVEPSFAVLGVSERLQLTVTGFYLDGSQADLTGVGTGSTYASSNSTAARVSGGGLVTGRAVGRTEITVRNGPFVANSTIEVVPTRMLVALQIAPDPIAVTVGGTNQVSVTAFYSDGSISDVTRGVGTTYRANPANLVNVSPNGLVSGLREGQGELRATFDGQTAQARILVGGGQIAFLTLIAPLSMTVGTQASFQVFATFTDGRQEDVTFDPGLLITSSNPRVASVSPGQVFAARTGNTTLNASYQGLNAQQGLTVIDPNDPVVALNFQPPSLQLPVGGRASFQVVATFASGNVADVSQDPNLNLGFSGPLAVTFGSPLTVEGFAVGSGQVNANYLGSFATMQVQVTNGVTLSLLVVAPSQVFVGDTNAYSVFLVGTDGSFTDLTFDPTVQLSSSGPIMLGSGSFQAFGLGQASITARFNGLQSTKQILVSSNNDPIVSIAFQPPILNLAINGSDLIRLIGTTASGAQVDITFDFAVNYTFQGSIFPFPDGNAIRITAVGPGSGLVEAEFNGLSASLTVNIGMTVVPIGLRLVGPNQIDLAAGPVPFTALVDFSDGSVQGVTFDPQFTASSGDPTVVQVAGSILLPISPGMTRVVGTYQGLSDVLLVEVTVSTPPTLFVVNPSSIPRGSGATTIALLGIDFTPGAQVLINGQPISTSFLDPSNLTAIVPANRLNTIGTLTVTVQTAAGLSNSLSIEVGEAPRVDSYAPTAVVRGTSIQVTAVGAGLGNLVTLATGGLSVSGLSSSPDGQTLRFTLSASVNATLGTRTLQLSNAFGSATLIFEVMPSTGQMDLIVNAGQTVTLSGTNVFSNLTINTGGRIVGSGTASLVLIATGDIVIRGSIEVNGQNGLNGLIDPRRGGDGGPGAGGGGGGGDGNAPTPALGGSGSPAGGAAGAAVGPGTPAGNGGGNTGGSGGSGGCGLGGGGGGFVSAGGNGGGDLGPDSGGAGGAAGSGSLFLGGTGGGGGSTCGPASGGSGGGGGGVLILQVGTGHLIQIDGALRANGGRGGDGFTGTGGGGGGSGGLIELHAPSGTIVVNDTISAAGGRGGNSDFEDAGGGGSGGRILLEATGGSVTADLGLLDAPGGGAGQAAQGSDGRPGGTGTASIVQ